MVPHVGGCCWRDAGVLQPARALRPLSEFGCEAKRLYVHPRFRGQGVGAALLNRLIEEARVAGYREMYGDTLTSMRTALQMYSRFGFCEVAPYSANPTPGAIFLKLSL
jgi:GNAT superfamily N-acetyltransferase